MTNGNADVVSVCYVFVETDSVGTRPALALPFEGLLQSTLNQYATVLRKHDGSEVKSPLHEKLQTHRLLRELGKTQVAELADLTELTPNGRFPFCFISIKFSQVSLCTHVRGFFVGLSLFVFFLAVPDSDKALLTAASHVYAKGFEILDHTPTYWRQRIYQHST